MKVSLNWLRAYLDLHTSPPEIADTLTSLGLEVEGWSEVKPSAVDLDKVVTAHVLTCAPIPDTDHLSATTVDTGNGVPRSIVCGAPNVAAGQRVLVALPGANVFSKDGQLFTIGSRKVRGVPSEGMICAEDELGIGHDHSGIMVLPPDTPLGLTAAQYLQQETDIVFEIGLTPNRADATSHVGVVRDLFARMAYAERPDLQLCMPRTENFDDRGQAPFPVIIENEAACPRYAGVRISGVKVQESPEWLQQRLLAVGQRPINNVVDVTNYVRLELGQPLHAFDVAAIGGGRIRVKTLPSGTLFKTLDGVERTLHAEDLIICDDADTPMCIGGVFGGANSGVSESTTDVFIESAYFHPRWIRRTMLRHNLRTDAAWNFEKGVDPNGTLYALKRAALLIMEVAGGQIASGVTDIYSHPVQPARVNVSFARINSLIGQNLHKDTVKSILKALNIAVEAETDTGFVAVVPTNKPDVTREADVIEEILRVYGLDNVPMASTLRTSMEVTPKPNPDTVREYVADMLTAQGFYEGMSMSLTNVAYFTGEGALLPVPEEALVRVHNTANKGLDCLRPTLLTNGLEAIRYNQNRQRPDLRLYEFGKTYKRLPDTERTDRAVLPFEETRRLALFLTGAYQSESWHPVGKKAIDYFTLKSVVDTLLAKLGISGYQETVLEEAPFQFGMRYHRGPSTLVTFGKVQPRLTKAFEVQNAVFFADVNLEVILKALSTGPAPYREVSKFPTVRRDLALILDRKVTFAELRQLAQKTLKKNLQSVNLFDVFEDETKVGVNKKSYALSFVLESIDKTLQDKEIDNLMQQLQQAFETKLNATIRK